MSGLASFFSYTPGYMAEVIETGKYDLNEFLNGKPYITYWMGSTKHLQALFSWRGTFDMTAQARISGAWHNVIRIVRERDPKDLNLCVHYAHNPAEIRKQCRRKFKACCITDAATVYCLGLMLQANKFKILL